MLKLLKTLFNIFRKLLTIFLIIFLAIVLTQRLTDNKKSIAGFRVFTVITQSMEPEYKVGDAIFTRVVDPSQIKIGDDITYLGVEDSFKDKIVTHRVIDIERRENGIYIFQTKGIANDKADPKINETQVYGKVLYKIKTISYLNGVIGNLYGMYFAIIVPLGVIMLIDFIAYRKDDEDDEEYDDEEEDIKKQDENKAKDEDEDEEEKEEIINKKKNDINKLEKKREKRKSKRNKRREKRRNRK